MAARSRSALVAASDRRFQRWFKELFRAAGNYIISSNMSRLGTYKPIMTFLLLIHLGQTLYHWELKRRGFSYLRR
uniref:Uncharacterized protein n=1 Tax=Timema genevievae TaxID=629358 RepID=A0A7R9PPM8_TIMGE|nr:unnamed protein product [Timema genevievae]